MKLGTDNPHHQKVPSAYTILFLDVPTFPDIMKFFDFLDRFLKKWVIFKMQQGKPPASNSLGLFPIEFYSKYIQCGLPSQQ